MTACVMVLKLSNSDFYALGTDDIDQSLRAVNYKTVYFTLEVFKLNIQRSTIIYWSIRPW